MLIIVLLYFHLEKCFSSFKNTYISDLLDHVETILRDEQESDIVVFEKEFKRIGNSSDENEHLKLFYDNNFLESTYWHIINYCLLNNLYLVVPSDYDLSSIVDKTTLFFQNSDKKLFEIEHHLSNAKHNKYVSIYKYVPYVPSPDIDTNSPLLNQAILKAFIPEFDTFIYQVQNKIVWLIGADIDDKTEIIYLIHTDQPELLPTHRVKHGFDNRGFNIHDKSEQERIGKYRVFEKDIPSSFHITFIRTGFNTGKEITWRYFSLTGQK